MADHKPGGRGVFLSMDCLPHREALRRTLALDARPESPPRGREKAARPIHSAGRRGGFGGASEERSAEGASPARALPKRKAARPITKKLRSRRTGLGSGVKLDVVAEVADAAREAFRKACLISVVEVVATEVVESRAVTKQ